MLLKSNKFGLLLGGQLIFKWLHSWSNLDPEFWMPCHCVSWCSNNAGIQIPKKLFMDKGPVVYQWWSLKFFLDKLGNVFLQFWIYSLPSELFTEMSFSKADTNQIKPFDRHLWQQVSKVDRHSWNFGCLSKMLLHPFSFCAHVWTEQVSNGDRLKMLSIVL